jgi:hypothetical protein
VKKACNPKVVAKVIYVPTKKLTCFNCGCQVRPGTCHCGAEVFWKFDPFDGWYESGSINEYRIVG